MGKSPQVLWQLTHSILALNCSLFIFGKFLFLKLIFSLVCNLMTATRNHKGNCHAWFTWMAVIQVIFCFLKWTRAWYLHWSIWIEVNHRRIKVNFLTWGLAACTCNTNWNLKFSGEQTKIMYRGLLFHCNPAPYMCTVLFSRSSSNY